MGGYDGVGGRDRLGATCGYDSGVEARVLHCWHALRGAVCGVTLGPGVAAVGLTPRYCDVIPSG